MNFLVFYVLQLLLFFFNEKIMINQEKKLQTLTTPWKIKEGTKHNCTRVGKGLGQGCRKFETDHLIC